MLKYYIPAVMLLISSAGYSKNRHKHFRVEGFAVKTDVLTLFNRAINKESKSYYLSGELYFNNEYSFIVDLGTETEIQPGWKRTEKRCGSHFRWYFKQDDCNCSAIFAGSYFSFINARETVDHNLPHYNAGSYNTSYFEGGISGGFQTILARHFVIDPAVQIGIEFPHNNHSSESMIFWADDTDPVLLVRISLGIGYRF